MPAPGSMVAPGSGGAMGAQPGVTQQQQLADVLGAEQPHEPPLIQHIVVKAWGGPAIFLTPLLVFC